MVKEGEDERDKPRDGSEGGANSNSTNKNEEHKGPRKSRNLVRKQFRELQTNLQKEFSKIKPPEVREHFPYVFSSPYPYCSTKVATFVMDMPEGDISGRQYKSRSTASGLCDPAIDHRMDTSTDYDLVRLPVVKKTPRKHGADTSSETPRGNEQSSEKRPPKEGTGLPKVPASRVKGKDLTCSGPIYFDKVPLLRRQIREKFSDKTPEKLEADYRRTRIDIYRMELDRFDQFSPKSRLSMRKCYLSYLQNTEGSKRAIREVLKETK